MENELSVKASELEKVHQDKIYTTSKLEAKVADAEKENEIKSAQIAKLQDKVSESRQEAEKLKAVNDSLKVRTPFVYSVVFAIFKQSVT